MNQLTVSGQMYGEQITLRRITKKEARILFCAGITIYLQGCKFHPFGVWQQAHPIELDNERINSAWQLAKSLEKQGIEVSPVTEINAAIQFNNMVNNYEYYNCDNERGNYASFYIQSSY